MNKAEWDELDEADRDAIVAERVMQWTLTEVKDTFIGGVFDHWVEKDGRGMYAPCEFEPTTDRNACALVMKEIKSRDVLVNERFVRYLLDLQADTRSPWSTVSILLSDPDLICYCAVEAVEPS